MRPVVFIASFAIFCVGDARTFPRAFVRLCVVKVRCIWTTRARVGIVVMMRLTQLPLVQAGVALTFPVALWGIALEAISVCGTGLDVSKVSSRVPRAVGSSDRFRFLEEPVNDVNHVRKKMRRNSHCSMTEGQFKRREWTNATKERKTVRATRKMKRKGNKTFASTFSKRRIQNGR